MDTSIRYFRYILPSVMVWLVAMIAVAQVPRVVVVRLHSEINPAAERLMQLALAEAQLQKADYVILDLNTYGGRIDNADAIVKMIEDFRNPVYAFINPNAGSAGAWISLACDKIYMTPQATIGAAAVVNSEGELAPDKYQSYMRGKMRAAAKMRQRNPQIAEAMVDASVEVPEISPRAKILTLTADEALKVGYCEGKATDIAAVLAANKLQNTQINHFELSPLEQFVAWFMNPYLSSLLLSLMIAGIFFELKTPGIGFPLLMSVVAGALYFIPYYLTGLAENWELAIFFVGVLCLLLEIFITPGFGFLGVSGLGVMLGSLFLMMLNNKGLDFGWVSLRDALASLSVVAVALLVTVGLLVVVIPKILRSAHFRRISLQQSLSREEGYTIALHYDKMVGMSGIAHTVLRPSGKIEIGDSIYDAVSTGDYIEAGTPIKVMSVEGATLRVARNDNT